MSPDRRTLRLSIIIRSVKALVIHPGEHLAEELEALQMSAAELARKLDVPASRVTQILNGTRSITGDTALRLAHFFGTSAQFWLNLQALYDLRTAQEKAGKSIAALPRLRRRDAIPASQRCWRCSFWPLLRWRGPRRSGRHQGHPRPRRQAPPSRRRFSGLGTAVGCRERGSRRKTGTNLRGAPRRTLLPRTSTPPATTSWWPGATSWA